jgi:hypothetical protein
VRPIGNHTITGSEFLHPSPDFEDPSAVAIPKREWLVEFRHYRTNCRKDAVGTNLLQNLAYLVRLLAGLLEPSRLAEFDEHPLGACRNQRDPGRDKNVPRANDGTRNLDQPHIPGTEVLEKLFRHLRPFMMRSSFSERLG